MIVIKDSDRKRKLCDWYAKRTDRGPDAEEARCGKPFGHLGKHEYYYKPVDYILTAQEWL